VTRRAKTGLAFALGVSALSGGCASDFDTTRVVPVRASLGEEMYTVICDRVGANALREDVTGASYHAVCHADANGNYATTVDQSLLVPLDPNAVNVDGAPVPLAVQVKDRAYRVARIEALGRRRLDMTGAFNAAFPSVLIPVKDLTNADPAQQCNPAGMANLQKELGNVFSRFTDIEDDGTIPLFTEALARVMNDVKASPDAQGSLTQFDARQGYRPNEIALGAARATLAYPRIVPLVDALLKLIASDSDPYNTTAAGLLNPALPYNALTNRKPIPGAANPQFESFLAVAYEELRTATPDAPIAPLAVTSDAQIPDRQLLSRPRTDLELIRQVLLAQDPSFDDGTGQPTTRFVTRRDIRGFAAVPLVGGVVPAPFVDLTGPAGTPDGLPDVDPLGQFIATSGATIPSPFFSVDATDGARDANGRAVGTASPLLYDYVDANQTFLATLTDDLIPLFDPAPADQHETVMNALAGAAVVFGARDTGKASTKQYPPDPSKGSSMAVNLPYRAFQTSSSPMLDLVWALGQLLADPSTDDVLDLARQLLTSNPKSLARLVGIGLQIKAIADNHPEAHIPATSTLWDELLVDVAQIAHVQDDIDNGGILEDLILAFAQDDTVKLQSTFNAYIQYRDPLTYDHRSTSGGLTNALNGAAYNLVSMDNMPLHTPVDRTMPDTDDNRSGLQRFMQLLHDANGLDVCTKQGAVAHLNLPLIGAFDYPTNPLSEVACALVGSHAPSQVPLCGILRLQNVDALLLDVALNRATFDVRDPCMAALMNNGLITGIVGGVDNFLETQSGIAGFDTHPTVPGVARLLYFETPATGLPSDTNPNTLTTSNFLAGVLDPVPTMVCDPTPFTDTDGTVLNLRSCQTPNDTMRARDPGFLFPIEEFNFVQNVAPLAIAFDDHHDALLFVSLFDTLHLHWADAAQPTTECDPSQPRTNSRWCSQDGAVTYEPLLADVFTNTDLLQALHDIVPVVASTMVAHCNQTDPATGACMSTTMKTGVQVLSDSVRALVDPARNVGLTTRQGSTTDLWNDGTTVVPQVTKIYLLIDALNEMDQAFTTYAQTNPSDANRLTLWRSARSQLVDTFLSVNGTGASSTFANQAIVTILPTLVDALKAQILAHCPDRSSAAACAWASTQLAQNAATVVGGPTFATMFDLLDGIRSDTGGRTELESLLQYILSSTSGGDSRPSTVGAAVDVLQVLSDDSNLTPLYNALANAAGTQQVDAKTGALTSRALIDAAIESLSRIFAQAFNQNGQEICGEEIDPNAALATALKNFVTPTAADQPAPIEVLIDIVADVNRADPSSSAKLAPADYGNMANEISEFCLDPASGLEQVYSVIREATE
jgi:hypothetical protein